MTTKRCLTVAAAAAMAGVVGTGPVLTLPAAPAQAQDDPPVPNPQPGPNPNPTPPETNDFQLRPSTYNSNSADPPANSFPGQVAQLDEELPKLGVQKLLEQANRPARFGADCSSPAFKDMTPPPQQYCFDRADTGKPHDPKLEWTPQGVTTVADAQQDQQWGGKKAILVSWYDKAKTGAEKGVRVSFLDPDTKRYQHVLLVYPYINSRHNPSYEIVSSPRSGNHAGIHAGGIMWYGQLPVRGGHQPRYPGLRHAHDLRPESGRPQGRSRGQEAGRPPEQHVLLVRLSVRDGAGRLLGEPRRSRAVPARVQVQRQGHPEVLVHLTGPQRRGHADHGRVLRQGSIPDENGRVARWPLNSATGLPQLSGDGNWHAAKAYRLPVANVQGATSYDGRWYLSKTGGGANASAKLVQATQSSVNSAVLELQQDRKAAIGTEDLSYWPGRNEIWTVTEHPGKRVLYGVPR